MASDRNAVVVERWSPDHPRWRELMALPDVIDLDLESKTQPWHLGTFTLVSVKGSGIVGVLRFWTQVIGVDEDKPTFAADDEPAIEAKVVTLHVVDAFRRQGLGRRLQLEAVRWARELGCYQVRSRSPYTSRGNHAMKAALGFGISPGRNTVDGDRDTAFFVLPLRVDEDFVAAIS
jgi:GNAT superfamily N-acetyltransferase